VTGTLSALGHVGLEVYKSNGGNVMANILVVEDNADLLRILKDLLAGEHEVHTARRGEEAVSRARDLRPDVVIMDLQLPSMSGIEAGRWIKDELGDVPILALTALAQTGDADVVLRSGCCDAYMAKPASLADIRRKVEELLDGASEAA
jgi:two-component system cell cycle response regulator DivK